MIKHLKFQLCSIQILASLIALTLATRVARADQSVDDIASHIDSTVETRACQFSIPGHGGGGVPTPFAVNQHVELAIGEFYSLYGTIIAGSDSPNATSANAVPMFAVDLEQHPWLANAQRARAPYYYLTGGWPFWTPYLQKRVLLTAQAKAIYITKPNGDRIVEIGLEPADSGAVGPAFRPVIPLTK